MLLRIAATLPPSLDMGNDIMYWGWSGDGRFTTSSAYDYLAGSQLENNGRIWKYIWSWSGPQRIRQFMWLVVKDRLLTNDECFCRHLAESATCVLCGATRETRTGPACLGSRYGTYGVAGIPSFSRKPG
ncbi:Unknown protein [Striga hermonthica]|uniref:Reverse transcriptase zinc-binding domain-containing protein n=1 Tax=Striga hermonthica TaxID=68872 RepID=A0A9N7RPJ4_STRHE|nr:Unknown protein [Striga hermonthica]